MSEIVKPALKPNADGKIRLTEEEWKTRLTEEEYRVLRSGGTEMCGTGALYKNETAGNYLCAGCDFALFTSRNKFESSSGWPSFFQPLSDSAIIEKSDNSLGMIRTEINCARCDGHLGHVFTDGPEPSGLRYCVNSVSLKFVPDSNDNK